MWYHKRIDKTAIVEILQTEAIFESAFMVDSYRGLDSGHFRIWIMVWIQRKGNPTFVQSESYDQGTLMCKNLF